MRKQYRFPVSSKSFIWLKWLESRKYIKIKKWKIHRNITNRFSVTSQISRKYESNMILIGYLYEWNMRIDGEPVYILSISIANTCERRLEILNYKNQILEITFIYTRDSYSSLVLSISFCLILENTRKYKGIPFTFTFHSLSFL